MHTGIATPELAANHHTGNGRDHLRIVERPDVQNFDNGETPVLEFKECGVPLPYHYSQLHTDSDW